MTIGNTTRSTRSIGDGITDTFSFSFPVFATTDIKVYKIDTTTTPETQGNALVENTDYTVSLNTATEGGSITYTTAPTANQDSFIIRDITYTQGADLVTNESYDEEAVEDALDRLTMLTIQNHEALSRSIAVNEYYDGLADFTLPNPEASKVIGWDSTGLAMTNYSGSDLDTILTTSYGQQLVQSADAETARDFLELGTSDDVEFKSITVDSITGANATTTVKGIVELATQAEANAGTGTKAITSETLAGTKIYGQYSLSATQTVTTGVVTKVGLNVEDIPDTNLTFDGVTNFRVTPTVAGTYKISAKVKGQSTAGTAFAVGCYIYFNGSEISNSISSGYTNGTDYATDFVTVTFNGTTDYVELYGGTAGSGNVQFEVGTRLIIERVK